MENTPIRILLVEDNPGDAALVRHHLVNLPDCVIEHVELVAAALNRLAKSADSPIDLILLDMNLPDSGEDATYSRIHESFPEIPVVVLTGIADRKRAEEAVRHGAQDYLIKGEVDAESLQRSIRYSLERAHWTQRLQESEERYSLAIRGANDGLWDWHLSSQEIFFSPRWHQILGLPSEESVNPPDFWFSRIHSSDREGFESSLKQHLEGKSSSFRYEHRLLKADGKYIWVLSRGLAVRDSDGRPYRIAGSLSDISDRKQFEEQLLRDAFYDSLTGLPNRALFVDRLGVSIHREQRHEDYKYAVLFLDLDRFKNVNDSLGHVLGDELLRQVADRLGPVVRQGDTVARLGGRRIRHPARRYQ